MSLFAIESSCSASATTDDSSNLASSSSTPPTTVADSDSLHSDASKHDVITVIDDSTVVAIAPAALPVAAVPSPRRPQRARASLPVYNLAKLSGTSAHGKRRSKGDIVANRRRRTIAGSTVTAGDADVGALPGEGGGSSRSIDALNLQVSPLKKGTPRAQRLARPSPRSLRSVARLVGPSGAAVPSISIAAKLSAVNKRGRKAVGKADGKPVKMSRELRRLQDTKEFSHIDESPVVHSVWSNGKYVDPSRPAERRRARNKPKADASAITVKEEEEAAAESAPQAKKRRVKKYLNKGLYSGQDVPQDIARGLTTAEKKQLAQLPELTPRRENKIMPAPIFTGFRILLTGRDFKLPFHVCNPLPPGQPKPDEWKKMTKSMFLSLHLHTHILPNLCMKPLTLTPLDRFIGESKEIWKKMPHILDYQSKCVCKPEDGCSESCQNRIMLYECDETNCNIGKKFCTNRAFADLTARRARGGKYRVGVEVMKTSDRGYGVRSNRCFRPHQIIMEYAGEIITEEECERRMNEIYKNNEARTKLPLPYISHGLTSSQCYYLMSFDQNMIIDATTGSIARFVNHSCNPNCRMIKWIVSGQPRMALFAGDRPIMTGEELTYDYNFDPFSAKNVQKCLCGQPNCRGVLGPKPKGVKPPPKENPKNGKGKAKRGKRKLKDLSGNEENQDPGSKAKKRKTQPAKPKPIRTLKAVKALKPIKAHRPVKGLKPVKTLKSVKTLKPVKGLNPAKTLKPIKVVKMKPAKVSKSKKGALPAKTVKRAYSRASIKVVKSPVSSKVQQKKLVSSITVSATSEISVSA
ncbi:histone-lysine n-methyltransferase ash1l [Trichoderma arundinaceum]|uniref:Histone-lysine n-methyltransferase ash1l n=1 Tax=Trichoderma arundinaceum TaxID=490622 RepID=A0A395NT55_TRIAR|nr:histone-lysine n-methyltransferase ash1l [Trichoderma arundinaceum]